MSVMSVISPCTLSLSLSRARTRFVEPKEKNYKREITDITDMTDALPLGPLAGESCGGAFLARWHELFGLGEAYILASWGVASGHVAASCALLRGLEPLPKREAAAGIDDLALAADAP
jgi:hypothetical protein